jgi:hypothetical protein
VADELTRRALFREVNTKICEIDSGFGTASAGHYVLCECGSLECSERFTVPTTLYDEIRASGDRFVVANGHQRAAETVVERGPAFEVVQASAVTGRARVMHVSLSQTVLPEPA